MPTRFAEHGDNLPRRRPATVVQVVTPVRAELHRALRVRAAEEGTTIRVLVMQGLRAIGLPVSPDDEKDRRGSRGNRHRAAPGPRRAVSPGVR